MGAEGGLFDVAVVGAGPGGLFAARELAGKLSVVVLDEKGHPGGAGAVTDGKLNLSPRIGLDLAELRMDEDEAWRRIDAVDAVFLAHGADAKVHGEDGELVASWLDRVSRVRRPVPGGGYDIELVPARQRHMGSDFAPRVVRRLAEEVARRGALFRHRTRVERIGAEGGEFRLLTSGGEVRSRYVVAAPGRSGAYWFRENARALGAVTRYGPIDIGCRVEVASPVYDGITSALYDPKFLFVTPTHGDRCRTFCTNPNGRVRVERLEGMRLVNGDALKGRKTANTNFAILNTVTMTEPLQDTTEMGLRVVRFANFWGGGESLVVQRLGDLLAGRRSRRETFVSPERGFDRVEPTLPVGPGVTPGDISFAYPGRIVDNLRDALGLLARVIPGVAHPSTAIYVPEVKFYDTRYETDRSLETAVPGLFVAGDGVGKSRGIVGAAMNGVMAAEGILRKEGK